MRIQETTGRRNGGNRHIVVSVLIMSAVAVIIVALFLFMFRSAKRSVLNIWENNVIQLAKSTEYYLARPADAIEFTASHVEEMIAEGRTNREIGGYLIREMHNVASLVENNYTGVYGFCRGEYLDASGWVPPPGYDPAQRPWYTAAKEAGGNVALVSPYLNLQTREMMMSISKLLGDGESVLSIDIFMDGLQKSLDDLALEDGVGAAFILDSSGCVVAHSIHGEGGKNYLTDGDDYHRALAERALAIAEHEGYFEAGPGKDDVLFAESVSGSWYAVLILNEASILGPVRFLNILLLPFLLLAFLAWYGVSSRIDSKYREADRLTREVKAVADIYEAMTLVDLGTDGMTVLRSNDDLKRLLDGDYSNYSGRIGYLAENMASEEYVDMLRQFLDPSTYEERLQDGHAVSYDFLSVRRRWLRIQLIVVDRGGDGRLRSIIWAVESIDKERRQQEQLKKLAETDGLSRLNNRRGGETRVRAMLAADTKGMFLLLDVDDFKSINDRFGHLVGDRVITAVADCLRRTFRDSDIVFRLGGDEFAAFAPGLEDEDAGQRLIGRLRGEIARISLPELQGSPVTVSVGTALCREGERASFEELYRLADERMYDEKRTK